jgi:hypothetical protein
LADEAGQVGIEIDSIRPASLSPRKIRHFPAASQGGPAADSTSDPVAQEPCMSMDRYIGKALNFRNRDLVIQEFRNFDS